MLRSGKYCDNPGKFLAAGTVTVSTATSKRSYTITCAATFRDAVTSLAHERQANVADLARSVVLLLPAETIRAYPDPGEPGREDRETVTLKSGPSAGRPWRRKPRLQVRLADGHDPVFIRRALAIALAMADGDATVFLEAPGIIAGGNVEVLKNMEDEIIRLRTVVSALSFDPLPDGITTRQEALHVLGFAPGKSPPMDIIKAHFRMMAAIHHPDSGFGSHQRMSQINEAMDLLKRGY